MIYLAQRKGRIKGPDDAPLVPGPETQNLWFPHFGVGLDQSIVQKSLV